MVADVRAAVLGVIGSKGDSAVTDYVAAVLEDEDFEWGQDAEDAYETFGEMLVGSGCVADDAAALDACRRLQRLLTGAGGDGDDNEATEPSAAPGKAGSGFRALVGGPVLLDEMNRISVHPSEIKKLGKNMIQGLYQGDGGVGEDDFSLMTDKDAVKIKRLQEKQEKQQMAAFRAHQVEAKKALAGMKIEVVRNTGGPAVRDIHLENFSISNGGAELIENGNCTLAFGRRYGLVGRNGTGKTTLLRHLAQRALKGIPDNCQILHVEQEVAGDDMTALDAVLECDTERTALLEEERAIEEQLNATAAAAEVVADAADAAAAAGGAGGGASQQPGAQQQGAAAAAAANGGAGTPGAESAAAAADTLALTVRLAAVGKRLHEIDAYGARARAGAVLAGLSFTKDMQDRATKTFSGGWRMRVALARALFVEPDLLLLDEPTNHLDLHAVLWLQDYLLKWPKTLIVVSHAREFLNTICTDVLHLHSRAIITYRGNYDTFVKTMGERVKNARAAAEAQDMKRKHMQAFIDKFRFNANRAALVQSRIKALERLADVEVMEVDPSYTFRFPTPGDGISPPILGFTDVEFAYPGGSVLFTDLNFGLDLASRFAIVGPNGIGKSTLLGLISGELEPTKGHVFRNPKVRMAVFSQHHVDGLDLALSPLQYMCKVYPQHKEEVHRGQLSSFGIPADLAAQPMYTLSGGQKSRVAMARVTFSKPHLLLLDEPSNHLDMDAVEALVEGLALFQGGVLMVSHDQHLIESTVDELWAVENGTVKVFHGTFEDYKKRLRTTLARHQTM